MPPFMPPPPLFQRVFYRILQTTPVVSSFEIWAGLSRFEQFEVHDFFCIVIILCKNEFPLSRTEILPEMIEALCELQTYFRIGP